MSTRRVPTATASLGATVAILLATLGNEFTRSGRAYAIIAALAVVLGAGSALAQLRKGRKLTIFEGLAALGGLTVLTVGALTGIARYAYIDHLSVAALIGTLYGVPLAAIACFFGGLGQYPPSWIPNIFLCTAGPAIVGFLAVGPDTFTARALIIATALTTIIACTHSIIRIRKADPATPAARLATAACLTLTPTMIYAAYIAATPPTATWAWEAPPTLLAWAYITTALLAALAGFIYRSSEIRG